MRAISRAIALLCAALLPSVVGLRSSGRLLRASWPAPRAHSSRATADPALPSNLDELTLAVRGSIRSAVLSGLRGLRVDACVPALQVGDTAYDPAVLARFCLELSHTLLELSAASASTAGSASTVRSDSSDASSDHSSDSSVDSDSVADSVADSDGELYASASCSGTVRILLPGMSAATHARQLLDGGSVVSFDAESRARLEIDSLTMCSPPSAEEARPAVVSPICRTPLFPHLTLYSCFFISDDERRPSRWTRPSH